MLKPLDQLTTLCPQAQWFFGDNPEAALARAREMVDVQLSDQLPAELRDYFAIVVNLFTYGVFVYEFFTVAQAHALSGIELALSLRFIEHHHDGVPLERTRLGESELRPPPMSFYEISNALAPRGPYPYRDGWRLHGHPKFNGSLASLLNWAGDEGYLSAWLAKRWDELSPDAHQAIIQQQAEKASATKSDNLSCPTDETARQQWEKEYPHVFARLRNGVAHPTLNLIVAPGDAAQLIRHIVAMIDSMWESG